VIPPVQYHGRSHLGDRFLEERMMMSANWKTLGGASLLALSLAFVSAPAFAEETGGEEPTTVDVGGEEPVDNLADGGGDVEITVDVPEAVDEGEPVYDPQIAESGVPTAVPETRRTVDNDLTSGLGLHSAGGKSSTYQGEKLWKGKGPKPTLFGKNSPLRDWLKKLAAK
jgi:hypothetical protein